jgi:hypothetical protein
VPADLGGKAVDELLVESGGFAGGQVMGQQQDGGGQVPQFLAALAQQMPQHPLFEIEQIGGPFGKILVPQVLEPFGVLPENAADGELRGVGFLADQGLDFRQNLLIAGHHQMGGEDGGILGAQPLVGQFLVEFDFLAGALQGGAEAGHLHVDGVNADEPLGDAEHLRAQHQRGADRHTR